MIRFAAAKDAAELLEIYAPYVTGTTVSFEYEVPAVEEFRRRVEETSARYPYAHPYAARPAYQWSAELTVYLRQGVSRRGLGSRLYGALMELLRLQGVRNVYGCVTAENTASVAFHHALGFREAGRFSQVGYKLGRWLDVLWLEKAIASGGEPQPLTPFPQVDRDQALAVLERWSKMK